MKHSFKTKVLCFLKEKSKYFKVISMVLVLALLIQSVSIAVTAITESDMFSESENNSATYELQQINKIDIRLVEVFV